GSRFPVRSPAAKRGWILRRALSSMGTMGPLLVLGSLREFRVLDRSLNPERKRQLAILQFGSLKPSERVGQEALLGRNCGYTLIVQIVGARNAHTPRPIHIHSIAVDINRLASNPQVRQLQV